MEDVVDGDEAGRLAHKLGRAVWLRALSATVGDLGFSSCELEGRDGAILLTRTAGPRLVAIEAMVVGKWLVEVKIGSSCQVLNARS